MATITSELYTYDSIETSYEPNEGLNWKPYNEYGFASPIAPRLWLASPAKNYFLSTLIAFIVVVLFAVGYENCRHWFLIPLFVCGALAGANIVAWFRKEIDVFDPIIFVGGFLYLNCFVTPLLHVANEMYGLNINIPDPPYWFGRMAVFNIFGLIVFNIMQRVLFNKTRPAKSYRQLDANRFHSILVPAIAISFVAVVIIFVFFGGLYEKLGKVQHEGTGGFTSLLLMLADPSTLLLALPILYWLSRKNITKPTSFFVVILLLSIFSVVQFLFVKERANRITILTSIFIVTLIIHYRVKSFSLKFVILGFCVVFAFNYLYNFRKLLGPKGWEAFYSAQARKSLRYEREITPLTSVLGSYARANVHAFLLYRIVEHPEQFEPLKGTSYAMALARFIPRAIWKTKPLNPKNEAGSTLLGYVGVFSRTKRQYGLAGEAMLNFRHYGIIPAFAVFGFLLGWFRKKLATLEPTDDRLFLIPFLTWAYMFSVNMEVDNVTFNVLKLGVLPFIVVYFGSIKTRFVSNDM